MRLSASMSLSLLLFQGLFQVVLNSIQLLYFTTVLPFMYFITLLQHATYYFCQLLWNKFYCHCNRITESNISDASNSLTAYILLYDMIMECIYGPTKEGGSWSTPVGLANLCVNQNACQGIMVSCVHLACFLTLSVMDIHLLSMTYWVCTLSQFDTLKIYHTYLSTVTHTLRMILTPDFLWVCQIELD